MTLLITGSTAAYSENWGRIFAKKKSTRKNTGAKSAKKTPRKKKSART